MSSYVEIANLALAHIGQRGNISSLAPPDGSEHAERAAQFMPIARDGLLERHSWGFATRRVTPAALAVSITGWAAVYAKPADCIEVLAVQPADIGDDYSDTMGVEAGPYGTPVATARYVPRPFVVETLDTGEQVILTDCTPAVVRYVARIDDPARFPALFTQALSYSLGSMLAGPLIKGDAGAAEAKRCAAEAERLIVLARGQDARQRNLRPQHVAPWIAVR